MSGEPKTEIERRAFHATRPGPYVARSASDRTEEWPYWLVHGADGVNCVDWRDHPHRLFVPREEAGRCAELLNAEKAASYGKEARPMSATRQTTPPQTALDDGGPAFPQLAVDACQRDGHGDLIEPFTTASGGMSLRDWFAGQALAGIAGNPSAFGATESDIKGCARLAYRAADAMLAYRKGGPQ